MPFRYAAFAIIVRFLYHGDLANATSTADGRLMGSEVEIDSHAEVIIQEPTPADKPTILDITHTNQLFTTMNQLVALDLQLTSRLVDGQNQTTAILPWDRAFTKNDGLPENFVAKLLHDDWQLHRHDFVRLHMYANIPLGVQKGDYKDSVESLVMMNGDQGTFEVKRKRTFVNGDRVLAEREAHNGHVFMLEKVLRPTWLDKTVLDLSHATFVRLAEMAGMAHELGDSTESITLLLPPMRSFQDLNPAVMTKHGLKYLLCFHMIRDRVVAWETLPLGRHVVHNMAGATLTLDHHVNGRMTINGVLVQKRQQKLSVNGIVQHIDNLLPKTFSSPPPVGIRVVAGETDQSHQESLRKQHDVTSSDSFGHEVYSSTVGVI